MEWDDSLAFGVELVDNQHKTIIEKVNEVLATLESDETDYSKVDLLLDFLGDYVMCHFSAEERLQTETAYPLIDIHKEQHQGFVNDYIKMRDAFMQTGHNYHTIETLNRVVVDWLLNHIGKSDKLFAEYYLRYMAQIRATNIPE